MLKPKRADRLIHCLVCWTCHSRMGPNHFKMEGGGAVCSLCNTKNPLGNLQKLSLREVTEPSEILICFTQGGTAAHALDYDDVAGSMGGLGASLRVSFARSERSR